MLNSLGSCFTCDSQSYLIGVTLAPFFSVSFVQVSRALRVLRPLRLISQSDGAVSIH